MTAGVRDIQIEQGATYECEYLWRSESKTGPAIDISGWTAKMQIRETPAAEIVLLEAITDFGLISLDGPEGIVVIKIPRDLTRDVNVYWGTRPRVVGGYDIELTDMEGVVHRFMMGRAIITREVTK